MDPAKKFSFGFSKVKKSNLLVKPVVVEKEDVQYVDSFDGEKGKFSYKGTTREEKVKEKLVIPLVGTKSAYDVIKAKLGQKNVSIPTEETAMPEESTATEENRTSAAETQQITDVPEPVDVKPSLENLAAQEILQDLKNSANEQATVKSGLVIAPDVAKPVFKGEQESTLDDYENVPISDFGLALLRGMGWKENTGIGKDGKVVPPITSKVRPKRLGLGAEGSTLESSVDVPINKGNYVKVLGGPFKGSYGVVEAVDGDIGRAFVKLDEEGTVSLSENVITVVTKKEYEQKTAEANKEAIQNVKVGKNWKYGINVPESEDGARNDPKSSRVKYGSPDGKQRSKEQSYAAAVYNTTEKSSGSGKGGENRVHVSKNTKSSRLSEERRKLKESSRKRRESSSGASSDTRRESRRHKSKKRSKKEADSSTVSEYSSSDDGENKEKSKAMVEANEKEKQRIRHDSSVEKYRGGINDANSTKNSCSKSGSSRGKLSSRHRSSSSGRERRHDPYTNMDSSSGRGKRSPVGRKKEYSTHGDSRRESSRDKIEKKSERKRYSERGQPSLRRDAFKEMSKRKKKESCSESDTGSDEQSRRRLKPKERDGGKKSRKEFSHSSKGELSSAKEKSRSKTVRQKEVSSESDTDSDEKSKMRLKPKERDGGKKSRKEFSNSSKREWTSVKEKSRSKTVSQKEVGSDTDSEKYSNNRHVSKEGGTERKSYEKHAVSSSKNVDSRTVRSMDDKRSTRDWDDSRRYRSGEKTKDRNNDSDDSARVKKRNKDERSDKGTRHKTSKKKAKKHKRERVSSSSSDSD